MASSSTSSIRKSFKYDVFLSFRGEKRNNFVDHLYADLDKKNIYTYKDDVRMKKGKRITDDLTESIKDSKIHIIVFSKGYPSSRSCLHELVEIMKCHKETEEYTACPVFYDVTPSEVRDQKGEFGKAFAKIEFKYQMGLFRFAKLKKKNQNGVYRKAFAKLKKEKAFGGWKLALKEAADLAGLELKKTADWHEAIFIQKIVEMVSLELRSTHFSINENLVGMESRIEDVLSSLGTVGDDVCLIGIKGMGGSGKTTLARALFDRISLQFEGKSFVDNVREVSNTSSSGLNSLQNQILSDVLNDQGMRASSVSEGTNMLKRMMGGRKVLLVLDDVDHMAQLEALAGDPNWFKPGSVIIITTRDEQVLVAHKVRLIRNVNLLSDTEAICLFSRYAFGREVPIQEYEELCEKVVVYAAGLPLTIKVFGSFLCGKSKLEWIDAIERLKNIPLEETLKKLELSYTGLEEEYKEIFLDVACILKGWTKDSTIQALEGCGFHAKIGLRVLEQKSLITFYDKFGYEYVGMHDHIEEMGRNIVRRLHPDKPNKHSRLWIEEEIEDIIINDLGTEATKCMVHSPSIRTPYNPKLDVGIIMKCLRKMKDLRFLHISWRGTFPKHDDISPSFPSALRYMHFGRYPFEFLPKTCEENNIVTLQMPQSNLVELWEGGDGKVLNKLRFLDLSESKIRILNLELTPNLETLKLSSCYYLEKLNMLVACPRLRSLHLSQSKIRAIHLGLAPNLETLTFGKHNELIELHMPAECPRLRHLELFGSTLGALDLGPCPNLETLAVEGHGELIELFMPVECPNLRSLILFGSTLGVPDFGQTPNIETLLLGGLGCLEELYIPIECAKLRCLRLYCVKLRILNLGLTPNVEEVYLRGDLEELHMPVECLKLRSFRLHGSKLIKFNLGLTPSLEDLELWGDLVEIYILIESLKLRYLNLSGSNLRTLDLGLNPNIEELVLRRCYDLVNLHVPNRCLKLKYLHLTDTNLRTLDLGLTPNIERLDIKKCYNLVELHVPNGCLYLHLTDTNLRTLDLGLTPNLKELHINKCYNLVELHVPNGCLKLKYLRFIGLELRTINLLLCVNLEKLEISECFNLVELRLPDGCHKLKYLECIDLNISTLDLMLAPILKSLTLERCDNLVEFHMPRPSPSLERLLLSELKLRTFDMADGCQKLEHLEISHSKLRTLDIGPVPNLKKLSLCDCDDLLELHIPDTCLNLKTVVLLANSKLTTVELGPTPNLEKLQLEECYDLEELHMAGECQKLLSVEINHSKLKTLDLGPTPNLQTLQLRKCYDLEKVHLADQCQKLVSLNISHSKLRTLDLVSAPNLEDLVLSECNELAELHMPSSCPNIRVLYATNSKLRTLDLGPTPSLKKLDLGNCFDLEEFQMSDECQNLTYLEISNSKLKTLNLGLAPNLEMLYLCESIDLVEFHMPSACLNLKVVFISNSKLRKLDLGLTPNLEEINLGKCYNLEELRMAGECLKLDINYSNLRTLDLSLTPNIKKLDLKGCYKLVELHVPIGGLKNLVYLDLCGCLRFISFLFQIKDDTDESFQFGPLAELSFILKRCPIHPGNNFPKFQFTCIHKEDLPSLVRNLEKLISGGFCACENLKRFSRNIFGL